jgi:hypothetical protein
MKIARRAVLSLVVLCASAKLSAQALDTASSPRAVVDAFFRATDAGRWADAVALLDLPPFGRYLRQRVNTARAALPTNYVRTPEQMMAEDSTLPRAVAEWQAQKSREAMSQYRFNDFSHEFAGITSFKALQALTQEEAAARWLEAQHPVTMWRRARAASKCSPSVADSIPIGDLFRRHTIGAVVIDDTTAYVLVADSRSHIEVDAIYRSAPSALPLRRREGRWRVAPTTELMRGRTIGFSVGPCPGSGR